jgi:3-hydroxyacyl-[acyl-carrier-protein] dehydratase
LLRSVICYFDFLVMRRLTVAVASAVLACLGQGRRVHTPVAQPPSSPLKSRQEVLSALLFASNPSVALPSRLALPAARRVPGMRMDDENSNDGDDFKGAAAWSSQFAEPEAVFPIEKVKDILPHRYPFLLVDKVIEFVPGKKAVGIKKVTANEEFFNGHFPARPIMPGVLQLEAMAQVGGIIALQQPVTDGKGDFFFAGVNKVKWRKPVVPGDTLVMQMELTVFKERFGLVKMNGVAYVDGEKVVEGEFQFAMVK